MPDVSTGDRIQVDEWQWRELLLSEHGPSSQTARLVALVIHAHMRSRQAHCWPSQVTIATRAQVSERQVRRVVNELRAAGWLDVRQSRKRMAGATEGRGWKMTLYYPAVPKALESFIPERPFEGPATFKRPDTQMSGPSNGADIHMSGRSRGSSGGPLNGHGADISTSRTGHQGIEDRTFSAEDRTPGCPTKSESEAIESSVKVPPLGGGTRRVGKVGRRIEPENPEEIARRIRAVLAQFPASSDEEVSRLVANSTPHDVRKARRAIQ